MVKHFLIFQDYVDMFFLGSCRTCTTCPSISHGLCPRTRTNREVYLTSLLCLVTVYRSAAYIRFLATYQSYRKNISSHGYGLLTFTVDSDALCSTQCFLS